MSKKKNTLKDLDDFLKQQAATLVAPTALSDTLKETVTESKQDTTATEIDAQVSVASILEDIKALSEKEGQSFRKKFYELIIRSLESQQNSTAEDKMLINTALYLKSPESWKETIRSYWKGRNR
jgi:predicted nucleic acid-binding protein